jgi:hypothetical protein
MLISRRYYYHLVSNHMGRSSAAGNSDWTVNNSLDYRLPDSGLSVRQRAWRHADMCRSDLGSRRMGWRLTMSCVCFRKLKAKEHISRSEFLNVRVLLFDRLPQLFVLY